MLSKLLLSTFFLLTLSISHASALYSSGDKVVQLTDKTFDKALNSPTPSLIEFYANWCGHCKNLAPDYKKVAAALDGIVRVAAVDMEAHQQVGAPYNVKGFPTIKFFPGSGKQPVDYDGQRTSSAMVEFALKQVRQIVNERAGGGSKAGKSSSAGSKGSKASSGGGSAVVELTESNFDSLIKNNDDVFLVEFFAPWCGHCKNLAPHWESAAKQLNGTVKLGAVDATVHSSLAQRYGVQGYPTIKVFKPSSNGVATDYNGGRTADDIVTFAKNLASTHAKPRAVKQLTSTDVWTAECGSQSICIVSVLPHIADTTAKQRAAHIENIQSIAKKTSSRPIAYVWVEHQSQPALEHSLGVTEGSALPAVYAVSVKKGVVSEYLGAFTVDGVSRFIKRLLGGKESTTPLILPSEMQTHAEWDGKDATRSGSGAGAVATDSTEEYDIDISEIIAATRKDDL